MFDFILILKIVLALYFIPVILLCIFYSTLIEYLEDDKESGIFNIFSVELLAFIAIVVPGMNLWALYSIIVDYIKTKYIIWQVLKVIKKMAKDRGQTLTEFFDDPKNNKLDKEDGNNSKSTSSNNGG